MKKAGIFAAVIAVVLLFMQFYNYRLAGYTEDAMYVIDGVQAANILKNGPEEDQSPDMVLKSYEAGTPLYKRGDKQFVGQDYQPLSLSYPVYVNEGAYLYNYSDELDLIASDFSRLNTYDGLYVVDGRTYNRDREQADPDEFLFVETSDGLFLNVQEMTIRSGTQEKILPVNSLTNPTHSQISWYQMEKGGVYRYKEYRDLLQADVTIGSVTMPYSDLVALLTGEDGADMNPPGPPMVPMDPGPGLEILPEIPEILPEILPGTDTQTETAGMAQGEAAEPSDSEAGTAGPDGAAESESGAAGFQTGEAEPGTDTEAGAESGAAGTQTNPAALEELPTHPPIPGDRDGWDFPSGGDVSGEDEEGGQGGEEGGDTPGGEEGGQGGGEEGGEGGDTPGGGEEGGQGSEGGGEEGEGGGEPEFAAPKVAVKNFDFSVYSATAELTIEDPSMSILKGVRLVFYKEGEARASYRKMYYGQGPISIQPLEPDTRYEVEGYFDYKHPDYGKTREFFQEKTYCGKTLPISALGDLVIEQQADSETILPFAIQLKQVSIKDASEAASPSDAGTGLSALDYISSIQMSFEKKGVPDWNGPETALSAVLTSQLKRGETIEWLTPDILESSSGYRYHIALYDRYGNQLPVDEKLGDGPDGEARTCKQTPSARLIPDRKSTVDKIMVNVSVENPDKAEYLEKPYLYVTFTETPEAPVQFTLEGEEEPRTYYYFEDRDEAELVFTSFLPSTLYTIWVRGSYDLEDGKVHEQELMGQTAVTTDALTSLGTVNFSYKVQDLTCNSARINTQMRGGQVPASLYPFVSRLDVTINQAGEEPCFSYVFERETLEKIMLEPGVPYELYTPEPGPEIPTHDPVIAVTLPADAVGSRSLWDTLLTSGSLDYIFEEDGLSSATDYQVSMRAQAVRGDGQGEVVEDVTGRYCQTSFKTLRKPASIDYEMSFVNGSSAVFYGLKVSDPDGAVENGKILIRLRNASNGALLEVRSSTVEELLQTDKTEFTGLEENTWYRVEVVAAEYNEGYTNATKKLQKLIGEITFQAQNTLYGSMTMDSMGSGYREQNPEDGFGIDSINLFEVNQAELDFRTTAAQDGVIEGNGFTLSDYIPVEPGKVYVLGGGAYNWISYYGPQHNYINSVYMSATEDNSYYYYRPEEGVEYVRISAVTTCTPFVFMSEMLFTEPDSRANLMKEIKITEGECWTNNGIIDSYPNSARTDLIPVTPGEVYVRMDFDNLSEGEWPTRAVYFYDENKQYVRENYLPAAYCGTIRVPENAAYMMLNLNKDYKDKAWLARRPASHLGENLLAKDSGVTWHDGMYVTYLNTYEKRANSYERYCDYVPVQPYAIYYTENMSGMQVFDAEKNFLGYLKEVSSFYQMPREAAYIRANVSFGPEETLVPLLQKRSPDWNLDSVNLGFQVTLKDPDNSLGDAPEFTLEYEKTDSEGNTETWEETFLADPVSRSFNEVIYIEDAEPGCRYQVSQVVEVGGNRIVLSTIVMSTASRVRVIKSEAALYAVGYAPLDDYVVTEDIVCSRTDVPLARFYGHMDFQGHRVTRTDNRRLVEELMDSGVIENLVMDYTRTNAAARIYYDAAVCYKNRGTLRNVVLNLNMEDNRQDNRDFGGLVHSNMHTGVVDGFAIQAVGDLHFRSNFGTAVRLNLGQVRNGYMVMGDGNVITLNPDVIPEKEKSQNWNIRGGLVAENALGGTVENVYAAAVMDNPENPPAAVMDNGLGVGTNSGSVRNLFSVGMLLDGGKPPLTAGPAVGTVKGSGSAGNISYVATMDFEPNYYENKYNNGVLPSSLWDQNWMESAVNGDGRFNTDLVLDGFYPQVQMPECMNGAQPVKQLPARTAASVKLLSSQVLEQGEDQAVVRFFFDNRNRLQIKDLDIAVMNLVSNIRQYEEAASTEILEQGTGEDGLYYADVRIFNPTRFRSQYYVNQFTAGMSGNSSSDFIVEENRLEKPVVDIEFYQPITSLEEWRNYFGAKAADAYGNYRLKADEFDFSGLSGADMNPYRIAAKFYGNITGQWTDENGVSHTAVLSNLNLEDNLISDLWGTISHVKVENLTVNSQEVKITGHNTALIGTVNGGTVDYVEISGAEIHGYLYVSALVGYLKDNGRITNCSARDVSLVSYVYGTYIMRMGGLAAEVLNGTIQNSFVQRLEIDNRRAFESTGTGGLAGYVRGAVIENCYASGKIDSNYKYVGGLAGYAAYDITQIRNSYAKVDTDVYGDFAGGLIGCTSVTNLGDFQGNLALGDLFVHSDSMENVHRLIGNSLAGTYGENYGFEHQMYNNKVDPADPDDAEALLGPADLGSRDTWLGTLGWDQSDYALSWESEGETYSVADGYLPLLKSTEGELLPGQEPIPYIQGQMKVEAEQVAVNSSAGDLCEKWFGHRNIETAFELRFKLTYDRERYEVAAENGVPQISLKGLNLNTRVQSNRTGQMEDGFTVTPVTSEEGYSEQWRFPFVETELGGDMYRLAVVLADKENPKLQITVSTVITLPPGSASITIRNAEEWQKAMAEYGQSFANFILAGDIDLSAVPPEELHTDLKINRLTSQGEKAHTISGVRYQNITTPTGSFINTCLSGISNVNFEDCTVSVAEDKAKTLYHQRISLIGSNLGRIQNVNFKNITIQGGHGIYTGCIGYSYGDILDVQAKDLQVKGDEYVGGVVGCVLAGNSKVERITAAGTLTSDGQGGYSSTYQVEGRLKVGGVAGLGNLSDTVSVTGLAVIGTNAHTGKDGYGIERIGGAIGQGSFLSPGGTADNCIDKSSRVADCYVAMKDTKQKGGSFTELGGAIGNGIAQWLKVENVLVEGKIATDVGGGSGNGVFYYSVVRSAAGDHGYTIPAASVTGKQYVGGVAGRGGAQNNTVAENLTVEALESYAGGISGRTAGVTVYRNLADRVKVTAPMGAGGIAGEIETNGISNCLVTRSTITTAGPYAGGIGGRAAGWSNEIRNNGVVDTVITAGKDLETGASYAGGIAGDLPGAGSTYNNYVAHGSQISGTGDCVGGLFGSAAGGTLQRLYIDNTSVVSGKNQVGGIFGRLQGRKTEKDNDHLDYNTVKFRDSYSAAAVTGTDYTGGIMGAYASGPLDPDTGYVLLNKENFQGVLMMGTVACPEPGISNLILNMEPDETGIVPAWSGKSLRIFTGASLNGKPAKEAEPGLEMLKDYKIVSLGGQTADDKADVEKLQSILLADSEDLRDKRFYNQPVEKGGMGWTASWRYTGLGYMDESKDAAPNVAPKISVTIIPPDGGTPVEIPGDGTVKLYDTKDMAVSGQKVPTAKMPDGATEYSWYRYDSAATTGVVGMERNTQELPLAGRGYYVGVWKDANKAEKFTPLIKVDSDSYMPQIATDGELWFLGGQEGLPESIGPEDSLWKWQKKDEAHTTAGVISLLYTADNLFYGGTVIPDSSSGTGANVSLQGDSPVTVYPSGASTVNVELGADYETLTSLTVESDGQTLFNGKPTQRVYTLDYDYRSPVEVRLTGVVAEETSSSLFRQASSEADEPASDEAQGGAAGDGDLAGAEAVSQVTRTVTVDSSALRRTVMVYGSEYYYTCGGKLMDGTGVAVDDEIIHLYGGQALSMDGVVYDLAGESAGAAASDPIPFWEDGELRAFGEFTEVTGEGAPMIQEQQLVRKDGELYALTGGQSLKGMVLDAYNGETYASFLNEDGRLKDAADPLHTPENFNRNGIAHMSSSLDAEVPYVLVRYANGAAKGFDYTTGEELPIENAFSDLSILDFAGGFLGQFMGTAGNGSLEFADLKELEDKLILSPIPENMTGSGSNRLDKTEVPKGEPQMAEPEENGSAEGGGANEESGGSGGVNDGSGNTADGENGALGGSEGGQDAEADSGSEDGENAGAEADADDGEDGQDAEADDGQNAEANHGEGSSEAGQDAKAEGGENAGAEADEEAASSENAGAEADGEENISSAALKDDLGGSQSGQPSDILDGQSGDRAENGQSAPALSGQPGDSAADGTAAGNGDSTADGQAAGNGSSTADGSAAGDGSESGTAEGSVEGTGEADAEGTADGQGKAAGSQSGDGAAGQADRQSGDSSSESGAEAGHSGDASAEADADKASSKNSASKDPARPAARSAAYTYAFNTKDGSSRLYNTSDLLTKTGSDLMDEEEKLELLKASGVVTEDYIVAPTTNESQSRTGAAIFAITAAAALGLTGLLIRRKRKYD